MKTRVYILALLALAMASFLLVHFGLIWVYGRFYIYESSPLILILETTMIVAIMAFSFYCMVEQLHFTKRSTGNNHPVTKTITPIDLPHYPKS